jgi:hypothetical protein
VRATRILEARQTTPEGDIAEIVIWLVPSPVSPSQHSYKYRAAFIVDGRRVLGFDNERGKGDHQHIGEHEKPYAFTTPDQLAEDFIAAIEKYRSKT